MIRILAVLILLVSCSKHESHDTITPYDAAKEKGVFYAENIILEKVFKHRCDKLTFASLLDAFGVRYPLEKHEYNRGEWHRDDIRCIDVDLDGNGQPDSKSEISDDGILGLIHALISRKDETARNWIAGIFDYGNEHYWKMGEGPNDLTRMIHLIPILQDVRRYVEGAFLTTWTEDNTDDALPAFTGHRGHLLALYIHALGRMHGSISSTKLKALEELKEENPSDPLYLALHSRYTDGDQGKAIAILNNAELFPEGEVPYSTDIFGNWGSSPSVVYYFLVLGVIEGK